jgi:flagellar biosynthesis protein FliR
MTAAIASLQSLVPLLPKLATGWLLLSLRIGAMLMMTPVFHAGYIPLTVRVLLILALSLALGWAWGGNAKPPADLWQAALTELALGCTLGLGILFAFAAISFGGRLMDVEVGFGMAQVIDPVTRRQIPVLSALLDLLAIVLFLLLDGHHALLRGLAYSLEVFPLGAPWPLQAALAPVAKQFVGLFGLGFALVAPVVLCVVLVEVALGVLARGLPQMNMLLMGAPVKIVAGVLALGIWIYGMSQVMHQAFAGIVSTWSALFALVPGGSR